MNLEQERDNLVAKMSEADYYSTQSPEAIKADGERVQAIENDLVEKYARWEFLEQKKELALAQA